MQRGQYLAVFAVGYGLRPNPAACRGFIDFDAFKSCARSDPVNSSFTVALPTQAPKLCFSLFPPFSLAFGLTFGRLSFSWRCLSVRSFHRASNDALLVRSSVLFGRLLVGGWCCPHVAFAPPKKSSDRTAFLRTPASVLFGGLLAGRQRCPHAAFARLKKSSHRTAFLTH